MTKPDFSYEARHQGPVCGVDEAGRGPLAGPVVAAAVILDRLRLPKDVLARIDDSKRLSEPAREALYLALRGQAAIGVGAASVAEIAAHNILGAALLAMERAVAALPVPPTHALIDGPHKPKHLPCPATAVVDGDALCLSIAAASIVAKVLRDRLMLKLHARYPGYAWNSNKGYGTAAHKRGLEQFGITPHHRLGFAPLKDQLALNLALTNR